MRVSTKHIQIPDVLNWMWAVTCLFDLARTCNFSVGTVFWLARVWWGWGNVRQLVSHKGQTFLMCRSNVLTFIRSCSNRSVNTCLAGHHGRTEGTEYPSLINGQCIQMFYNRLLLSPSLVWFDSQNNRIDTVHFTRSLTFLYQHHYIVGFVVYWNWRQLDWNSLLPLKKVIYFHCWVELGFPQQWARTLCLFVCLPSSLQCLTLLWLGQVGSVVFKNDRESLAASVWETS